MPHRPSSSAPRIAVVTDTLDHVDGIALGLRRLAAAAARAGRAMTLIGPAAADVPGLGGDAHVLRVPAAMSAALPFYPQYTWTAPDLAALTAAIAPRADVVQLATPGPMGIAGLIAARMLGLPVVAQYHTEVADYAGRLTGLPFVKDLVAPIVGWFYQQADVCLAPSRVVEERLIALGVAPDRIRRVRRGVDLALFDPARRDRAGLARYGVEPSAPVVLYVGRLSREKNLDALHAGWREVLAARPDARLLVAGDGPQPLDGDGIVRTGVLHGEELAALFASADVLAFPSETETFGNVVVEAAASGLPAVVARAGASHEHVVDGVTGIVADPAELGRELLALLGDDLRRARMTVAARAHAVGHYDLDAAVIATWQLYAELPRVRHRAPPRVSVVVESWNVGAELAPLRALMTRLAPQLAAHGAELAITHTGLTEEARAELVALAGAPIAWVELPPDATYYDHKNHGFAATTGDIVAFLDGDCEPAADWIAAITAPIALGRARVVAGFTTYPGALAPLANQLDFPYFSRDVARGTVRNFFANNVAFARDVFAARNYPAIAPMFHGQCQILALELDAEGISIVHAPAARVVHAWPDSARAWLAVRLLRGADAASLLPYVVAHHAPSAAHLATRFRRTSALAVLGARAALGTVRALRGRDRLRGLALVAGTTAVDALGCAAAPAVYRYVAPRSHAARLPAGQ